MKVHPGYLARNQDVCKVYGLCAGLCKIQDRLKGKRSTPQWLLADLENILNKANCLIRPLVDHRDEISPHLSR